MERGSHTMTRLCQEVVVSREALCLKATQILDATSTTRVILFPNLWWRLASLWRSSCTEKLFLQTIFALANLTWLDGIRVPNLMESVIKCYRTLGVESLVSLSLIVKLKGVSATWITYLHGLVLLWCFFNRCTMCFLIIYEQARSAPKSAETPSFLGTVGKVPVFFCSGLQISIENTNRGGSRANRKIREKWNWWNVAVLNNKTNNVLHISIPTYSNNELLQ